MQNLKKQTCELANVDTQRQERKPYRMQSILQSLLPRLTKYKFANNLQLVFASILKPAGVMENVTVVVGEDEFVLDVIQAMLHEGRSRSAITGTNKNEPAQPPLLGGVQPGRIMSLNVPLGMKTHPLAVSPWTKPEDLRALRGVTYTS